MTEPHRVLIEADYGAGGIWLVTSRDEFEAHPRPGSAISTQQPHDPPICLQLTQGLRDDLEAWNQAWEASDGFWEDEEDRREWEKQGRELAIRVQYELGADDWDVLYRMNGRILRVHPRDT